MAEKWADTHGCVNGTVQHERGQSLCYMADLTATTRIVDISWGENIAMYTGHNLPTSVAVRAWSHEIMFWRMIDVSTKTCRYITRGMPVGHFAQV